MLPETFGDLFSTVWGLAFIVVFLGGSIFIHELGHFLAARKRGLIIERFSIGFGPKILGWKSNGVEYRISLLPLGGYVALPQMADMGMLEGESTSDIKKLPPISFADKMIVAVMGAVCNILLALAIATVLWFVGVPSNQQIESTQIGHVAKEIVDAKGITVPGPAHAAGIRPGDTILAIDGYSISNYKDLLSHLAAGTGRDAQSNPETVFKISRDGKISDVKIQPALVQVNKASGEHVRDIGIDPAYSLTVNGVFENSPAHKAGLKPGDYITGVDTLPVHHIRNLIDYLKDKSGQPVKLRVVRESLPVELEVVAEQVPYTKPLARLNFGDQENSPKIEFLTAFAEKDTQDPSQSSSKGRLVFFDSDNAKDTPLDALQFGDVLISVNGTSIDSIDQLVSNVKLQKTLILEIERKGQRFPVTLHAFTSASIIPSNKSVMLGFQGSPPKTVILYLNPLEQFYDKLRLTLITFKGLISPQSDVSIKNLSGPITIGRVIHRLSNIDFRQLLAFIVFININLAVMNLLPIPVLDGGHMLMATIAKLRGRQLPPKIIAGIQGSFMVMFMGLMFYVMFFDSLRWWGDNSSQNEYALAEKKRSAISIPCVFK